MGVIFNSGRFWAIAKLEYLIYPVANDLLNITNINRNGATWL